jgi:hypothetical protein
MGKKEKKKKKKKKRKKGLASTNHARRHDGNNFQTKNSYRSHLSHLQLTQLTQIGLPVPHLATGPHLHANQTLRNGSRQEQGLLRLNSRPPTPPQSLPPTLLLA